VQSRRAIWPNTTSGKNNYKQVPRPLTQPSGYTQHKKKRYSLLITWPWSWRLRPVQGNLINCTTISPVKWALSTSNTLIRLCVVTSAWRVTRYMNLPWRILTVHAWSFLRSPTTLRFILKVTSAGTIPRGCCATKSVTAACGIAESMTSCVLDMSGTRR
jgi:hypothetical protein